ncbi:MAG: polysaccharide biosynthesis protein, partial [Thermodesulfobacteriota bacterium]
MEIEERGNIKSILKQIAKSHFSGNFSLKNLGYLPRWVILLIDSTIILTSVFVAYFLLIGLSLRYVNGDREMLFLSLYFGINLLSFWWFKTYSGIIRHSSFIDAVKILFSQISTFIVLLTINFGFMIFDKQNLFLSTGLLINVIFSFCLLFLYRVLVKQIFESYFKGSEGGTLVNALVYGSDANAISVSNALKAEIPTRFKLVGFIDKYNQNASKRILDLPILQLKRKISVLMRQQNAEALILADKSLTKEEQIAIVEECLEYNLKVYTVPLITDWENQKEISEKIKTFQIEDLLDRKPIILDNKSISSQLYGKTILITGAAGSIGSEIVRQVVEFSPKSIIILD